MVELNVALGDRSYPLFIDSGCLEKIGSDVKERGLGNKYAVIVDTTVAEIYGKRVMENLAAAGVCAKLFPFPAGEKSKNLRTVAALAGRLVRAGYDRHDAIVALGGGVTGDLAGFLAATYMRGIPFVQVPTTLLAQVDSSVGGKTGVDIAEGKNLVGAFYQPKAVYIDPEVLATLAHEQLLSGLAEVIKYGVIRDASFFTFLEEYRRKIVRRDPEYIIETIQRCCQIKADVVEEDEQEGGVRRILNYGHTLGHAIEAAANYEILHGLAVAMGMVAAARLSVFAETLSGIDNDRIYSVISAYGLPVSVPEYLNKTLIKRYLKADKKIQGGKVHFVLPKAIGMTYFTDTVTEQMIDGVLQKEWSYIL